MLPASPLSTKTCLALQELWKQSSEGLNNHQCQELKKLLDDHIISYAANVEGCTWSRLVQHSIDIGLFPPIRLWPHLLALAFPQVAEGKIREMAAALEARSFEGPMANLPEVFKIIRGGWLWLSILGTCGQCTGGGH